VSKRTQVDDETDAALASLKGDDETFDELLTRLLAERRGRVGEGAGLREGTDATEAARRAREEPKDGVGTR
jgi:predicted CopG family antitoxin